MRAIARQTSASKPGPIEHSPASRFDRLVRVTTIALSIAWATASCAPVEEQTIVEEAVCAAGATVEGVDVSIYQGSHIDWHAVHASGRQFAITRINDGLSSMDPTFS